MATSRKRAAPATPDAVEIASGSVEETHALGEQLGRVLRAGDVVAMYGELGSGKTTLVQGMAQGLGRNPQAIKSPTFVLMREYPGEPGLIHVDGYRLEGAPAVAWLDLDLMFSPYKITCIEWAERFADLLPPDHLAVRLTHVSANRRKFQLSGTGQRGQALVAQVRPIVAALPGVSTTAPENAEPHAPCD